MNRLTNADVPVHRATPIEGLAPAPFAGVGCSADGLARSFRRAGGLVTGDQLAALMAEQIDQPLSRVARWIVQREIVHFGVGGQILVPLFQFDRQGWVIRPDVRSALAALRDHMDDLAVAAWFAAPSRCSDGCSPLGSIRELDLPHPGGERG